MNTISKIIGASSTSELENATFSFAMPWEEMLPDIANLIEKKVMLRSDEMIAGFILSDEGMDIKINRKKGRKTSE